MSVKAKPAIKASTAAPEQAPKASKQKKPKMVRDSFTMPQADYDHIPALKARCAAAGINVKKSELLRAALSSLAKLSDKNLIKAINSLATIKTGRPAKSAEN